MNISHFLKFNRGNFFIHLDELKQNEHLKNKLIPSWAAQPEKHEQFRTNNYLRSWIVITINNNFQWFSWENCLLGYQK